MARSAHDRDEALARLKERASEANRAGMARFGIATDKALGVAVKDIRAIARTIERDHSLAEALWRTGIHEARILAALVDRPEWVTPDQMERWVSEFDSWDLCDQVCGNLFDRTPFANNKILAWADDEREFVRRAAFATMAWRAVHDKNAPDEAFLPYLPLIRGAATDPRNFVKKAVNWALRQIGKRSARLHGPCLALARELAESDGKTVRWIGRDAVRELERPDILSRLGGRERPLKPI